MFVDASAIVAIVNGEPEAAVFADALERSDVRATSPSTIFEAVLGICRVRHATIEQAATDVDEFLTVANIQCAAITEKETRTALVAFDRYGKGRGYPAQLNLGGLNGKRRFSRPPASSDRLPADCSTDASAARACGRQASRRGDGAGRTAGRP